MNIDETVKALRDKLNPNGTITLDVDGVGYILDMIERMGNLVEKYECEVIPDYHKVAEQLQAEVERMGIIIDRYQGEVVPKLNEKAEQLQAENERLKASRPVKCGECIYAEHDEEGYFCGVVLDKHNISDIDYCSYGRRDTK